MPKRAAVLDPKDDPYVRHQLSSLQKLFTGLLFPASVPPETAAQMLGVHSDIMPYLHDKGLLKSLEPKEAKKVSHYHVAEILEKTQDRKWMAKVMEAAREYHAHRNARKKARRLSQVSRSAMN
jgi:hypothetical protein